MMHVHRTSLLPPPYPCYSVFLDWDGLASQSGCLRIQGYIIETRSPRGAPPVDPVVLDGTTRTDWTLCGLDVRTLMSLHLTPTLGCCCCWDSGQMFLGSNSVGERVVCVSVCVWNLEVVVSP